MPAMDGYKEQGKLGKQSTKENKQNKETSKNSLHESFGESSEQVRKPYQCNHEHDC